MNRTKKPKQLPLQLYNAFQSVKSMPTVFWEAGKYY